VPPRRDAKTDINEKDLLGEEVEKAGRNFKHWC
jgi:hypothetical protein